MLLMVLALQLFLFPWQLTALFCETHTHTLIRAHTDALPNLEHRRPNCNIAWFLCVPFSPLTSVFLEEVP